MEEEIKEIILLGNKAHFNNQDLLKKLISRAAK